MVSESPKTGFWKNFFGFGKNEKEQPKSNPPVEPQVSTTPGSPVPARAVPQTEAYQNRNKGRKEHSESIEQLKKMIALIESRGEVNPGELAQELGMSRSTLTYSLKNLMDHKPGYHLYHINKRGRFHRLNRLMGLKKLVRLGAGRSVRYKIVVVPPEELPNDQ